MDDESGHLIRFADYIRKAEEADHLADQAKGETARNSFRALAQSWRDLAAQVKRSITGGI